MIHSVYFSRSASLEDMATCERVASWHQVSSYRNSNKGHIVTVSQGAAPQQTKSHPLAPRSVLHYRHLSSVRTLSSREPRAGIVWPTTLENIMAETWDVFISYARADHDWVRALATNLHNLGLDIFFDEWEIGPGDVLVHRLDAGVLRSRHGVLVVSPAALARPWVQNEYAAMMTPCRRRPATPHPRAPGRR